MSPQSTQLTAIFLLPIIITCSAPSSSLCVSASFPKFPCSGHPYSSYPFCNTSLPIDARARCLTSLLRLHEKISLLSNNASAVPRLGLPAYEWWSESLHGIASNGPGVSFNGSIPSATSFPQVLLMAAAFNRSLWSSVGSAIAVEARAMYNTGQAGLTFWAPNINIFRDPRWGRGQETPGEDPMLVSAFAVEYVKGFQGRNGEELMVSACCKHFTAYDLEKWGNFSRYSFDAVVTEQDLMDTYQPPFRSCIQEAKASCLMCSYNRVNGVPACARKNMLEKVRSEWGFEGYITSDCDAVATVFEYQQYSKTPEDAVADVLKAGMDINCGTYLLRHTKSALKQGKISEEDIDRALFNLFSVQLRLGLFDGELVNGKFGKFGPEDVCSEEHRALALEAARQGIVLLKNDKNFLPLKKNAVSSLAVIGPMANGTDGLGGGYTGIPCNPRSLYEELRVYVEKTTLSAGCRGVPCESKDAFSDAILAAKDAELVLVVAGLDLTQEREDNDRVSLLLPGKQMDLVSSIASMSKNPIILVLTGGGPLDVSFAENNPKISSILWIGYPGEAGGKALAEVVFGDFNPGGRLPMTWYPESFISVPMNDMHMRADSSRGYPGRTYRFYNGDRIYGFGHGLSYTSFTYKFISAPRKLSLLRPFKCRSNRNRILEETQAFDHAVYTDEMEFCESLRFRVQISVMNNGDTDGSHVVLLFSRPPRSIDGVPEKQLIGFDRVHTAPSHHTETSIEVDPCNHLSIADGSGKRVLLLGEHVLMLGDLEHSVSVETY
ncbi:hypothetical protein SAY87_005806 [Trapa incisa]|uniref:Fibronectin type III-like domain-containing protein n=1 Tax=Trapa incisa TaxID=236973 RepID=A0AAN7KAH8_9MYRT|nr:hypothetical protein SAY87_005806 [Trapa incisa]